MGACARVFCMPVCACVCSCAHVCTDVPVYARACLLLCAGTCASMHTRTTHTHAQQTPSLSLYQHARTLTHTAPSSLSLSHTRPHRHTHRTITHTAPSHTPHHHPRYLAHTTPSHTPHPHTRPHHDTHRTLTHTAPSSMSPSRAHRTLRHARSITHTTPSQTPHLHQCRSLAGNQPPLREERSQNLPRVSLLRLHSRLLPILGIAEMQRKQSDQSRAQLAPTRARVIHHILQGADNPRTQLHVASKHGTFSERSAKRRDAQPPAERPFAYAM